ncbi:MAG: riboflavin synthase [Alphaproteobacteria bacterium]|nr:riboflavin synthase [Alphaproteobacteria bacterium]
MFTGIIQDIGSIAALEKRGDWVATIATGMPLASIEVGASVACSGICLTVIAKQEGLFTVQLSPETLDRTTARKWEERTRLNLERALCLGDELGGHIVTGHVDGRARIVSRQQDGDSVRFVLEAPQDLARFIAAKGSVTLDGVSLTVNEVEGAQFGVNIIPHTQQATTMGTSKPGDFLNIEVDMIARYLDRLMEARGAQ